MQFIFCADFWIFPCTNNTAGLLVCCSVGQEETKVDMEDGIRFTPFNLREEYEEGEFDADGMYIFKKNKVVLSC